MRLIDADKLQDYFWDNRSKIFQSKDCRIAIDNAPTVEAIPITKKAFEMFEADYENRLKADMVAMLTEIQLEIEELDTPNNGSAYMDCVEIIQEKINALGGEQNG